MEFLGRFHPQIVHTPIALIIVGALFELIGRATDVDWWRKAAFAMLFVGVLGGGAAVLSGREAEDRIRDQHVPHHAVEEHEEAAFITLYIGLAALLFRALATRPGRARPVLSGIALLLHLLVASTLVMTAYRGGKLVYEHAAGVSVGGQPVPSDGEPGGH